MQGPSLTKNAYLELHRVVASVRWEAFGNYFSVAHRLMHQGVLDRYLTEAPTYAETFFYSMVAGALQEDQRARMAEHHFNVEVDSRHDAYSDALRNECSDYACEFEHLIMEFPAQDGLRELLPELYYVHCTESWERYLQSPEIRHKACRAYLTQVVKAMRITRRPMMIEHIIWQMDERERNQARPAAPVPPPVEALGPPRSPSPDLPAPPHSPILSAPPPSVSPMLPSAPPNSPASLASPEPLALSPLPSTIPSPIPSLSPEPSTSAASDQQEIKPTLSPVPSISVASDQQETKPIVSPVPSTSATSDQQEAEPIVSPGPSTSAASDQQEPEPIVYPGPSTSAASDQQKTKTIVSPVPSTSAASTQEEIEPEVSPLPPPNENPEHWKMRTRKIRPAVVKLERLDHSMFGHGPWDWRLRNRKQKLCKMCE